MSISSLSNQAFKSTLDVFKSLALSPEELQARRRSRKRCKERKQELSDALVPLPSLRERALTLPLPENDTDTKTKKAQKTHNQPSSRLFSMLPTELRFRIYKEFFAQNRVRIVKDLRPRYVRWVPQDRHFLPLLLTCRRIYSEAIDLLYSHADFYFNDLDTILWFASTVLPKRLNMVRTIFVEWDTVCYWVPHIQPPPPYDRYTWFKVWELLASMEGLRELHVRIWNGPKMNRNEELDVFSPLREVKGTKLFELELPWQYDGLGYDDDPHADAPYTIIRVQRHWDPND